MIGEILGCIETAKLYGQPVGAELALDELSELERKAKLYDENKEYIELGIATEKAFEDGLAVCTWYVFARDKKQLLEWAKEESN